MQIVIDIDEKFYQRTLKHYNTFPRDISSYEKQIIDGIPLPNNATNGNVMKALFNISLDDFKHKWGGEDITDEWWNAPYRTESEESWQTATTKKGENE